MSKIVPSLTAVLAIMNEVKCKGQSFFLRWFILSYNDPVLIGLWKLKPYYILWWKIAGSDLAAYNEHSLHFHIFRNTDFYLMEIKVQKSNDTFQYSVNKK